MNATIHSVAHVSAKYDQRVYQKELWLWTINETKIEIIREF